MKKIVSILALSLSCMSALNAQTYNDSVRTNTWQVFVAGGMNGISSLRNANEGLKMQLTPEASVGLRYNIKPMARVALEAGWTQLNGRDKSTFESKEAISGIVGDRPATGTLYQSRIKNRSKQNAIFTDLKLEVNVMEMFRERKAQAWNLYLGVGLGYMHGWGRTYETWAYKKELVAQGEDYFNGQTETGVESDTHTDMDFNTMYVPISLSLEWDIIPALTAGFRAQYRSFTQKRDYTPDGGMWGVGFSLAYNFNSRGVRSKKVVIAGLQSDLAAVRAEAEDCGQTRAALNKEVNDLRGELEAMKKANDDLKRKLLEADKNRPQTLVIYHDINDTNIDKKSEHLLIEIAEYARSHGYNISIKGYADSNTGNPTINEMLSKMRAEAAKNILVKVGVPESMMKCEWFGGVNTEVPPGKNRRTVVDFVK